MKELVFSFLSFFFCNIFHLGTGNIAKGESIILLVRDGSDTFVKVFGILKRGVQEEFCILLQSFEFSLPL